MDEPEPTLSPVPRASRARSLPTPGLRRATVIGAGSFGTALALLLTRGGLRTTLQTRTAAQAALLDAEHENRLYLPGVELPSSLRIEPASAGVARADYVFLAVPSQGLGEVIEALGAGELGRRTALVSVAKGLVPPAGLPPTIVLSERFGAHRVACIGGPAHAQEMVHAGAALVAASSEEELASSLANVFTRAGVVCEQSNDPVGVELAGAAKNAAALAAGATEAQGLNAAGAAAGHIFAEVWR
jgi:glycerol-3-phosphate dehydrogenase (NAD(P)+)